ncbi:alanine--tRNA ligase [Ureaplasma canigenitalium]|uniref:alanine--tRNA ligase n=1 Tax=Ureaplasma canigenitalium TaxID=42092 RepID=UPI0004E112E1|nr:alanine--tRNA ligase [Ureaplasma canigenitalium]
MLKLSTNEIRQKWINFFTKHNHLFIEPKSLVPINDPSLLWINSGVATLKDYFSARVNPPHTRLVNSQKAIRTNDIFNVGRTARHHTLFEMLGNFSIGDYFKKEAIDFAYDFLINELKIDVNLLWITVYIEDEEAYQYWINKDVKKDQILRVGRDRCFWDVGSGPCGPCTEIYYDRGEKYDPNQVGTKLILDDLENDRYIEIWNIVFSQFNNDGNNVYTELKRKNIDTGAGLERLACISQDVPTNFDTDQFIHIINSVMKYSTMKYDGNEYFKPNEEQHKINFSYKVIADHIRAVTFAIADGVIPSAKDRGYILRRLIRRMLVNAHQLKITNLNFIDDAILTIMNDMNGFYTYLTPDMIQYVVGIVKKEASLFNQTLEKGLSLFHQEIAKNGSLNAATAFKLFDTYGFPLELIRELLLNINQNIKEEVVDLLFDEVNKLFLNHQKISNQNKNNEAMAKQNDALLNLHLDSKFLYHTYTKENAKLLKIFNLSFKEVDALNNEDGYLIFNETPFYATSGGQQHDIGTISDDHYSFDVIDVFKSPEGYHVHKVRNATVKSGMSYLLQININYRVHLAANHTSEHLLHYTLKHLISDKIKQEGAAKYFNKATFDFFFHRPLTNDEITKIENHINQIIKKEIDAIERMVTLEEAKKAGALAYFEDVYNKLGEKLRMVQIGPSIELCGGTHVENTREIEYVKLVSFETKGSGSYRITMVSMIDSILDYYNDAINTLIERINQIYHHLNPYLNDDEIKEYKKVIGLQNDLKIDNLNETLNDYNDYLNKMIEKKMVVDKENNVKLLSSIKEQYQNKDDKVVVNTFFNIDNKIIFNALSELINEQQKTLFVSLNFKDDVVQYLLAINEAYAKQINLNLNHIIKSFSMYEKNKGGGKAHFVQGGMKASLSDVSNITKIIEEYRN